MPGWWWMRWAFSAGEKRQSNAEKLKLATPALTQPSGGREMGAGGKEGKRGNSPISRAVGEEGGGGGGGVVGGEGGDVVMDGDGDGGGGEDEK